MYFYTDPTRENETHALPNAEVFHAEAGEWAYDASGERCDLNEDPEQEVNEAGFYYWYCFPGCLPDRGDQGCTRRRVNQSRPSPV
jgi:hypothetical protein